MEANKPAESAENQFTALAALDVGEKIEKKNGLSYLSWAWAVDVLLRHDPKATWTYDQPASFGQTMMVFCTVNAFGKSMTAQLPVMDHRNKAIPNPDAFAVNTAMQRCLVKAIALHGLGLYIYAGEDLPPDEKGVFSEPPKLSGQQKPTDQQSSNKAPAAPAELPPLSDANFQKMKEGLTNAKTLKGLTGESEKIENFFKTSAKPSDDQLAAITSLNTARLAQLSLGDD